MRKVLFILVLLISYFGFSQNETLFQKATTAYNDGKYDEAITDYLKIIANGKHSPELYFNLGNAYYKLNKVAPSIYYYEKALLLNPNDVELKNNLAYAKNMTLDAIENLPETNFKSMYKKVTGYYTFDQWAYINIALILLFVIAYISFRNFHSATKKRISFIGSLTCLFLSLLAMIAAYLNYSDYKQKKPAIVFEEESIVQAEPNNRSQEVFRLHEGTKVYVLDNLNDWYKIKLADGKSGWISSNDIKLIKN